MAVLYITPLAFILGFALGRVSTCTVAATDRLVFQGKTDWLLGLLFIASWAAMMMFLLVQYSGRAHLPVDIKITWQLFFGAAIMGLGAIINRGCFIGTVGYIGTGKFSYLLSIAGLALALYLARGDVLDLFSASERLPRSQISDSWMKQTALAAFATLCFFSLWKLAFRKQKSVIYLMTIGISAAVIYGTRPEWAYGAVLNSVLHGQGLSVGRTIEFAVVALFAGAIFSNWLKNSFHPDFGTWKFALANLVGGFLMGIGAAAVPGGNDVLLLWTIPGLAFYGVVAYAAIIVSIAIILVGSKWISGQQISEIWARRNQSR